MKKLTVLAACAALLASVSVSSFASTKSMEDKCNAQAEKHKISKDKLDAYVKTCVKKHMKRHHVKHAKKAAAPAAPAAAPAPAESAPAPAAPAQPAGQ